jgi:tetratricopeptide (TPR) repeat protein
LLAVMFTAEAAEPVVFRGDAGEALARASRASGRPVGELVADPLPVGEGIEFAGVGAFAQCAGGPQQVEAVTYLLERAEAALTWDRREEAAEALTHARAALGCVPTAQLAAPVVTRFHLLTGVLAAGEGRRDEALDAFDRARELDPDPPWGDGWPYGRELLDLPRRRGSATVDLAARATLLALPREPGQELTVAAGPHPFAVGEATGILTLGPGRTLVLDPSLVDLGDPAGRPVVERILVHRYGEGAPALVVSSGSVWAVSAGRGEWRELERLRFTPLVPGGAALTGLGAAVAVVGLGGIVASVGRMNDGIAANQSAEDEASWRAARDAYDRAREAHGQWVGVAALGGAGVALGLGVTSVGLAVGRRPTEPEAP